MRRLFLYLALALGSAVFLWPFLWMIGTSMKLDREVMTSQLRLFPRAPVPAKVSPYWDDQLFADLPSKHQADLLPEIESALQRIDMDWGVAGGVETVQKLVARGLFKRLSETAEIALWNGPSEALKAQARALATPEAVDEVMRQLRRSLGVGQLRARSYDLVEDGLVAQGGVSEAWRTLDSSLVASNEARDPFASWRYDFSKKAEPRLEQTFKTSFPLERLHRLQLEYRSDDGWHAMMFSVEMKGRRYEAERPIYMADRQTGVALFQEPGPDDQTNKIRNWVLLREAGTSTVTAPDEMKVTIALRESSLMDAWGAKILRNYQSTLRHIPFWRYVGTSLFLVILTMVATLFSCSLVAYSFARLQWPGRGFCFALMLATMMIPPQVTMIPNFLIIRSLGWYNTLLPLWVPHLFAGAFNVFLLRQFLKGIPKDLEDAARIDGCGFLRIYWHVMLPLIKPTLAAIAIFTFMGTWNDFMGPLIYLSDQQLYPLSFGLYALNVQAGGSLPMMMAGSLLMTLPIIALFFFAQRYFMQGVTLTGIKG